MKVLIVLLATFGIGLIVTKLTGGFNIKLSAQIAMAVMMTFTALGHFKFTQGMAMMLPAFIPYKKQVVYITGVIEIAAAVGLLIPAARTLTAWCLILFFVVLTPANIHAAIKHLNMEKAAFDGPGPEYLWFRIPLQLLFIAWVYWSCLL